MIKIAQVGLGYGQYVHIPAFRKDKRFKIVGVCSEDIIKAKKVSKKFNIQYFTNNIENLFDKVDALSIAVPPHEQKILLPLAIKKGIHVFFEKPLGFIPSKKHKIIKNQALVIDYQFVELDVWKDLKDIINKKELGRLLHIEILWNNSTFAFLNKMKSWKTNPKMYGGVLNNFGSHVLYYIESLFGKISNIKVMTSKTNKKVEEVVYLNMVLANKCIISACISSNTLGGSGHLIEVTGDKGSCSLSNSYKDITNNFRLDVNLKNGNSYIKKSKHTKSSKYDQRITSIKPLVKKFGDWIEFKKIQKPNFNDAIRVEYLLKKCRLSIKKNVTLKI